MTSRSGRPASSWPWRPTMSPASGPRSRTCPPSGFDATEIRRTAGLAGRPSRRGRGRAAGTDGPRRGRSRKHPGPRAAGRPGHPGGADLRGEATPPPQGRGRPHPAPVRSPAPRRRHRLRPGRAAGQARGRTRPHVRRPGVGDPRRGRTLGPASAGGRVPVPRADRRCRENSSRRPRRSRRDSRSRSIEPRRTDPLSPIVSPTSAAPRPRGTTPSAPSDRGRPRPPREPTGATPEFVDDAAAAGLRFTFDNGRTPQRLLPETLSGGVGLLDFDGDGWLDVYCVQGGDLLRATAGPVATRRVPGRPPLPQPRRRHLPGRDRDIRDRRDRLGAGLRPGRDRGRLRQRRASRPVRHPAADATPSTATAATGPSRTSPHARGLAGTRDTPDLGGVRRPRQRRRPRPLRLPLHALGPGESPPLPERQRRSDLLRSAQGRAGPRPRLPQRRRPVRGRHGEPPASPSRRPRPRGRRRRPRRRSTASTSTSPTTARPITCSATRGTFSFEEIGAGGRGGRQRRGRIPGGHGRGLRRPRRRRPARPDGHQLLRRGHDALQEPGRGLFADQQRGLAASASPPATCWASASRWPTSTTTAGSTS